MRIDPNKIDFEEDLDELYEEEDRGLKKFKSEKPEKKDNKNRRKKNNK